MAEIQANNFDAFAGKVSKPHELKKARFFVNTRVFPDYSILTMYKTFLSAALQQIFCF